MNETGSDRGAAVPLMAIVVSAVLLLGCALAVFAAVRFDDPDAYAWAPRLADRRLGVAIACVLLVACCAAAGAIRLAQGRRPAPARVLLVLVIVSGIAATVLRVMECPAAARYAGVSLRSAETGVRKTGPASTKAAASTALTPASLDRGKPVFMRTCAACHGPDGGGVKGQGASLRDSAFVRERTDDQLLAFVKAGRQPFDPQTRLHLTMPARGGNPSLTDQNLFDAIAVIRSLEQASSAEATQVATAAPAPTPVPGDQPRMIDGALWYPHSILAPASDGPRGTAAATVRLQQPGGAGRSLPNIQRFFSIALLVAGLHIVYLAIGLFAGVSIVAAKASSPAMLVAAGIYWLVIGALGVFTVAAFYF